jgi:hypothetical protein
MLRTNPGAGAVTSAPAATANSSHTHSRNRSRLDRRLTWPDRICYLLIFAGLLFMAFVLEGR